MIRCHSASKAAQTVHTAVDAVQNIVQVVSPIVNAVQKIATVVSPPSNNVGTTPQTSSSNVLVGVASIAITAGLAYYYRDEIKEVVKEFVKKFKSYVIVPIGVLLLMLFVLCSLIVYVVIQRVLMLLFN